MRVAAHYHRAQVGRQPLFFAGSDHEDTGIHHALTGNLELAPREFVRVVDEQHRLGVFAVFGQGFGALVLFEGFPRGAGVVQVGFLFLLAFAFPPFFHVGFIAPRCQRAQGVQAEWGGFGFRSPNFPRVLLQAFQPFRFAGVVRSRHQNGAFDGDGFFADGCAFAPGFGHEQGNGVSRAIRPHL